MNTSQTWFRVFRLKHACSGFADTRAQAQQSIAGLVQHHDQKLEQLHIVEFDTQGRISPAHKLEA